MTRAVRHQEIRERAYALWQQAGCPANRDDEFWHRAKEELSPGKPGTDVDEASKASFPASDPVNHM